MAVAADPRYPSKAIEETVARNFVRILVSLLRAFISSLIGSPLPILRDADADQFRIGQEDVGRQSRVVAVEERSSDRRNVEDILVIEHHLPAVLVGENERQVDGVVTTQLIERFVIEHAPPRRGLPIEIARSEEHT